MNLISTSSRTAQGVEPANRKTELTFYRNCNFTEIREIIGDNFVKMPYLGMFFRINPDDTTDWSNPISSDDLILNLKDRGLSTTEADIKRIFSSDAIRDVTPLHIVSEMILQKEWNAETDPDHIGDFVKALKLKGSHVTNVRLLRKAILTAYGLAFQDIDPEITHRVSPRVLPILYSQQRELGKSSVLRWLGLEGRLLKAIPKLGQDVYAEKQGGIFNDDREFKLMLSGGLVINFDDVGELMMNAKSKDGLKSYCTMVSVQQRILHSNKVAYDRRRASIWGSTNDLILRDESENRFCIFELTELIDFEWLNSVDPLDLWRQARAECLELGDESNFTRSDTDLVKDIAKKYMYTNALEDIIEANYTYDPNGVETFNLVKAKLEANGLNNPSSNAISKAIKRLVPEGQNEKKISNGYATYKIRLKTEQDHRIDSLEEQFSKSQNGEPSEPIIVDGDNSLPF